MIATCHTKTLSNIRLFQLKNVDIINCIYSKNCLKRPFKRKAKIGFQDQLSLNAGQKYCRMLQREHSAILLTFIKLPFAIKTFLLSIFKWPLKTVLTVYENIYSCPMKMHHLQK